MSTDPAGIGDSGSVHVNGDEIAQLEGSGLEVVAVPDPRDPPKLDETGALLLDDEGVPVYVGGVLFVAAPVGSTLEEAQALIGEPGEVKGPSAHVWGDEHAARFGATPDELALLDTPQGLGEPVKGPAVDHDADEVIDPPSE